MLEDPYEYGWQEKPRLIIPALIWLGIIIASIVLALMLTGCATEERYLTAEQDAKMREICEPAGCEVVPSPVWQQIERILHGLGMRGS